MAEDMILSVGVMEVATDTAKSAERSAVLGYLRRSRDGLALPPQARAASCRPTVASPQAVPPQAEATMDIDEDRGNDAKDRTVGWPRPTWRYR